MSSINEVLKERRVANGMDGIIERANMFDELREAIGDEEVPEEYEALASVAIDRTILLDFVKFLVARLKSNEADSEAA